MRFEINNISRRYIELTVDEISTSTLDQQEAKELAIHLITVASELLEVESENE